jgi:hypothetical protein
MTSSARTFLLTTLDINTGTSSGVTFKVALVRDTKAAITGDVKSKHYGCALT